MRVLLVYQDSRLASSRVRVLQVVPYLEELGCHCRAVPYPAQTRALRALIAETGGYDLVLLQKKLPSWIDSLIWQYSRAPVVYDYDDAVMLRQKPKRGEWHSRTRRGRFERVLGLASGISAGNRWLAAACSHSEIPVLVLPSPVPFPAPSRLDLPPSTIPVVGWIGSSGNLGSLDLVAPGLVALAGRRKFILRVISDGSYELEGVQVENLQWSVESQEAELAHLDVGIMPLEDTPWSQGKCAYKLLQYMAAGVLAIGSEVGMNAEVITNGESGLLVGAPSEWEPVLERALDDIDTRRRLGAEGRKVVAKGYTHHDSARRWSDFFELVCARG